MSNFHVDRFANPEQLQQVIYSSKDVVASFRQIGVHLNERNLGIAGYEVQFPKGFRVRLLNFSNVNIDGSIEYYGISEKVLINTACGLREFFLQAREYASDDRGNVMIPIIARFGLKQDEFPWIGDRVTPFTKEWRSDSEKVWLAEEKRISLERQHFASRDQQERIQERMKAIEAAANKAMQKSEQDSKM